MELATFEMKECLNECQKTFSEHPKRITHIRDSFEDPKEFLQQLFRFLKRIFHLEKAPSLPLKRLLKFIARVGTFSSPDKSAKNWSDSYCNGLIMFCLSFVSSRVLMARLRAIELLGILLNDLPDDFSLCESIFDSILEKVYPCLKEPNASVRIQAVMTLSRLQQPLDKEDKITKRFLKLLERDRNQSVREICLKNIGIVKRTLPCVLARTRDSSDIVRKTSYSVIKDKLDVRSLSISQRNEVLRNGLRDRNSNVKEECEDLLLNCWLQSSGSILEILKLLDVEENEEVAKNAIETIIKSKKELGKDCEPPFNNNINAEKAFLWRIVCESLGKEKETKWIELERILIDTKSLLNLAEQNKSNNFIFKQLLGVSKFVDVKDEVNREFVVQKTESFLTDLNVPNECVPEISEIARLVFPSETSHAKHSMSTILKLLSIAEENINKEELSSEKKKQLDTLVSTRILEIIKDTLRFSKLASKLPDIDFIKEKIIIPSITKDNPFIRAAALEALALYCYFDVSEARKYIVLLCHVLKNDQETLKLIALKSIIDLILTHGELSRLMVDPLIDNEVEEEKSEPSRITQNNIIDCLSAFLGSDDEIMMYTAVEGFAKLITLGRVRTVKPLSMCILLLFNPNSGEDEPIQQCLSLFFSSFLFLGGNNFSNNLKLFAKAFMPTLKIILHAPKSSPLSKISVIDFAQWAFSFVPQSDEVVQELQEVFKTHEEICKETRKQYLLALLKELERNEFDNEEDNEEALELSKILTKLQVNELDEELQTAVEKAIEIAEEKSNDKMVRIYLRRLHRRGKKRDL